MSLVVGINTDSEWRKRGDTLIHEGLRGTRVGQPMLKLTRVGVLSGELKRSENVSGVFQYLQSPGQFVPHGAW